MRRFLLLAALSAVTAVASAMPSGPAPQADLAPRLSEAIAAIDRALAASKRPAVVIGITDRTGTLKVLANGHADLKTKAPIAPESLFEIGSISKSFTAVALMQLFDEGRFDPRLPIKTYLPWFEVKSTFGPITGHHLLTHTAGIPNYRPDAASMAYATYALRDFEPRYAPGEHFWYSNTGFQTLGYALEHIERRPYPTIVQRRIFDRLGMTASAAAIEDRLRTKLVVSYAQWPYDGGYVEEPWFEYRAADGSITTTAADLAAYARMILNRGATPRGRVLSERAFGMLTTPTLNHYAYGLFVDVVDGDTIVSHEGGIAGFVSRLEIHMHDGFAVVVLSSGGYDRDLVQWIGNCLKAAFRGHPRPDHPRAPAEPASDWAGLYTGGNGQTLEFVIVDDRLTLKRGDLLTSLTRVGPDTFRAGDEDLLPFPFVFGRRDSKVVELLHGPEWYRNESYSGPTDFAFPTGYGPFIGRYESHNPESHAVRIFVRKGTLVLAEGASDGGRPLIEVAPATFRPADPEYNPELYRFDSIVEGHALRLLASGMPMYRVDAP